VKPWLWQNFDHKAEKSKAERIVEIVEDFQKSDKKEKRSRIVVLSKPPHNKLYSKKDASPQRAAFLHVINNARDFIRITNVNLNVPEVIDALTAAISLGVRVEILLPDDAMELTSGVDVQTNCQAFSGLQNKIDAIGKSHLLDLRWQASENGAIVQKGSQNHAKYMNADGVAIVGSSNLDIQSWKYSSEVDIAIADRDLVDGLDQACFLQHFKQGIPFKNSKNTAPTT
jgi:phosphatidylserine/phosphatidylglycerophosphate/cardiolipin synthase-like enzyme